MKLLQGRVKSQQTTRPLCKLTKSHSGQLNRICYIYCIHTTHFKNEVQLWLESSSAFTPVQINCTWEDNKQIQPK